jgi:ABC-2 type transport system permease protein
MKNSIKTEWLKIKNYRAFWGLISMLVVTYPAINFMFYKVCNELMANEGVKGGIAKAFLGKPFEFPDVWKTVGYLSSWFVMIPAVLVIMLITNEFTYKTNRQNIIDGWTRRNFIASKFIDVVFVSILVFIVFLITAFGFGYAVTKNLDNCFSKMQFALYFLLQTFAQLSIAFLIGFLIRKAFLALGIFLFYFLIAEPILVGIAKLKFHDIGRFLPLEISDRIVPKPSFMGKLNEADYAASLQMINIHIVYTILLTALVWCICIRVNDKRNL